MRRHLPKLPAILAALFLLHMVATTAFWTETLRALSKDQLSYSERRAQYGFHGMIFDGIRLRLNEVLAPESRIALAPQILKDEFFVQRLTESIYPRLIDHTARNGLELAPLKPENTSADTLIQQLGQNGLFLRGPIVRNIAEPQPEPDWDWSAEKFAACALATVGLGGMLWVLLSSLFSLKSLNLKLLPGTVILLSALFLTFLTNLLTYLQISAPANLTLGLGLFGAIALTAAIAAKKLRLPDFRTAAPRWESWILALLIALIAARVVEFPITQWDGRSIWFFNAKRIFTHGMFLKADIIHSDSLWSHPDYPLLYPAWLAHFSSSYALFSERMASLGIPVLLAATLSLLWYLARRQVGRWPGAALALGLYLAVDHATLGGYVDGFLMFLLLIEFLAFSFGPGDLEPLAWIAAAAASLIKAEGIILGGTIALVFTMFRARRNLWPFLVFSPALLHKVWIGTLGAESLFKGKAMADVFTDFFPRLATAFTASSVLLAEQGYTQLRDLLWDGLCGLLLTTTLCLVLKDIPKLVKIALIIVAVQVSFAFCSISMLPEDVSWFVGNALDRLLLHPAALLTLLPFLLLTTRKAAHAKKY